MTQGLDWLEQASRGKFSTEETPTPAPSSTAVGTGFYPRMQKTANRLLIGKGQTVTITHTVAGTYDPATGLVNNSLTTQTGTGAILDYSVQQAGVFNAPGSLVRVGDKQLLLSPLDTDGAVLTGPSVGDMVTVAAGTKYTITQIKEVSPAGTVVLYDINLRGV